MRIVSAIWVAITLIFCLPFVVSYLKEVIEDIEQRGKRAMQVTFALISLYLLLATIVQFYPFLDLAAGIQVNNIGTATLTSLRYFLLAAVCIIFGFFFTNLTHGLLILTRLDKGDHPFLDKWGEIWDGSDKSTKWTEVMLRVFVCFAFCWVMLKVTDANDQKPENLFIKSGVVNSELHKQVDECNSASGASCFRAYTEVAREKEDRIKEKTLLIVKVFVATTFLYVVLILWLAGACWMIGKSKYGSMRKVFWRRQSKPFFLGLLLSCYGLYVFQNAIEFGLHPGTIVSADASYKIFIFSAFAVGLGTIGLLWIAKRWIKEFEVATQWVSLQYKSHVFLTILVISVPIMASLWWILVQIGVDFSVAKDWFPALFH